MATINDNENEDDRRFEHPGRRAVDKLRLDVAAQAARIDALERTVSRLAYDIEVNISVPLAELIEGIRWFSQTIALARRVFCPLAGAATWIGKRILWVTTAAAALLAVIGHNWKEVMAWAKELFQ